MKNFDTVGMSIKNVTKNVAEPSLKEMRNSYFCVTPKNNWLIFVSTKNQKALSQIKVIMSFYNLCEENFSN